MNRPEVEFWFEFASTYSYPSAMRIAEAAAARQVTVRWRPFLLGPIFAGLGWSTSPFLLQQAKGRYMWHDVGRTCARLGLAFHRPAIFPQHTVLAARLALVGADAAWGPAFVRGVFAANFADGADISDRGVLGAALERAGADATSCLEAAGRADIKQGLRDQGAEAERLGIFGAPSFIAAGDLYWGHDRMIEALEHAARSATGRGPP